MTLPLLLVGHGTREPAGVEQFHEFVTRVQQMAPHLDVSGGFIELADPPITEAVASLSARGHREIVAVPLVLVAASHSKGDVPAALLREQVRMPGLSFRYGRPLGVHPTVVSLLDHRLNAVVSPDERSTTAVVVVGRGATDPDANADVAKVARLVWEGRDWPIVEPAFISLTTPSVPDAMERCRLLGATRIAVVPYFLFAGVLPDRVVAQAREYAAAHGDVDVRVADLLRGDDAIAELVLERYAEAIGGDIRMNCDTCIYRIALPGFDEKVGAAQAPHDHPADRAHGRDHLHGHAH
ncbi:MAG: sirohydrochlorin chelatase [Mycobacteriales bacterium]